MEKPVFGKKEEGKPYRARYGAYVVITRNEQQEIIIVQAPNGAYFLPGGEIEGAETHHEAIDREMLEELGYQVKIGAYLGEAIEYFYSSHRDTYFEHPGYFYQVDAWEKVAEPTEKTNELAWVSIADAMLLLKRGSHRWAVQEWEKRKG